MVSLLSAPTLRSADVQDDARVLRALAKATALEELTVSLHALWPMDDTRLLLRNLAALQLRKLALDCCTSSASECPLYRIERLSNSRYALARCCPNLSSFRAYCSSRRRHRGDPGGAIWTTLPHIRTVTISRDPPDGVIPRLKAMQSLRILDAEHSVTLAGRLGASVTHLSVLNLRICSRTSRRASATAAEITTLSECGNISKMSLVLEEGSEGALLKTVCTMFALCSLELSWSAPRRGSSMRVIEFLPPSGERGLRRVYLPRYSKTPAGVMLRVVQQAPLLTAFYIIDVRIRVPS